MRAVAIEAHGEAADVVAVRELPDPEPGPAEVVVRLRASALNHLDLWAVEGLPGLAFRFPFVLGADGAGVIERVGPGVDEARVGEEVVINPVLSCGRCDACASGDRPLCRRFGILGEHRDGSHAELVAIPAVGAVPKPPELGWEDAAAVGVTFATAWRMLFAKAQALPGETALIHGIGGGLALAALTLAHAAGVRCIVTSSDDAKLERAAALGAAHGVNYTRDDVAKAVRAAVGSVDLVIDSVGAPVWDASIRALRNGGRLVCCGVTGGDEATVPLRHVFWRQIELLGSTMASDGQFRAMLTDLARNDLRPTIDRVVSLDEVPAALGALRRGEQFGKIVVGR